MALFKRKTSKKKKFGNSSNISKLRSPYRKKNNTLKKRKIKRSRSSSTITPPAKLRNSSESGKAKVFLAIILSIGIFSYSLYAAFFSDLLLIENFIIIEEGTIIDDNETMNTILRRTLSKNLLLLSEEEIIQKIRSTQPEIEKIEIKKVFPDSIKVEYEKYPTAANLINIVDIVQKKFLIDSQGFLVEENIEHPDLPYIYYKTDEFLEVRNSFLNNPTRSQTRLTQIVNATKLYEEKFAMKILYAEYKNQEREVHLQTEKHFYIMLDLEKDLVRQIEKLKKALAKLDIYNEPLVYIDLRISGTNTEKVIFKRR